MQSIVLKVFCHNSRKYLGQIQLTNQSANQRVLLIKNVRFITITPIAIVTSVFIMQETPQMSCKEHHVRVKWFYTEQVTQSIVKFRLTVAVLVAKSD